MGRFIDIFASEVVQFLNRHIGADQLHGRFCSLIKWQVREDDPGWLKTMELLMAEHERGDHSDESLRQEALLALDCAGLLNFYLRPSGLRPTPATGSGDLTISVPAAGSGGKEDVRC